MSDVKNLFGPCESTKCQRPDKVITNADDLLKVADKTYHKGCEPTKEEQEASRQSST